MMKKIKEFKTKVSKFFKAIIDSYIEIMGVYSEAFMRSYPC